MDVDTQPGIQFAEWERHPSRLTELAQQMMDACKLAVWERWSHEPTITHPQLVAILRAKLREIMSPPRYVM